MKEVCPKCGKVLEIVECCGGGIWVCEDCKEYYYYGELISKESPETLPREESQEAD